jgi:hypothetical protein
MSGWSRTPEFRRPAIFGVACLAGAVAMYLPPQFVEEDETVLRALIEAHPLGLLISSSETDLLANPVPFLVSVRDGVTLLRAHLSKANPQWSHVRDGARVLVVFQGSDSYVTPSWVCLQGRARQGGPDMELRHGAGAWNRNRARQTGMAWPAGR